MNELDLLMQAGLRVIPEALLKDHTTFRLGGPCRAMVMCTCAAEVCAAVKILKDSASPFLMMGFGSNILASDQGVDAIMIRYSSDTPRISGDGALITADAATQLDQLVECALQKGLLGLESFSGIPGTLAGALAGNAGAYGRQVSDNLVSVDILDAKGTLKRLERQDIAFSYRDSSLKHDGSIILSATFQLATGGRSCDLLAERTALLQSREQKHGRWQDNPCAGSFFRNVLPTSSAGKRESAGWFLEQAGCKDLNIRGAHALASHANIITRDEGASAQDVFELTRTMAKMVEEKFNLKLEREVRLLGRFEGHSGTNTEKFW